MKEREESLERALEAAVSRALRDSLPPLQRTADDLHQAYADLVSACASVRPTNALPAMLRAQTAAAALSAGLNVLSNFVTSALNSRDASAALETSGAAVATVVELDDEPAVAAEEPAQHSATLSATFSEPVHEAPVAEAVAPVVLDYPAPAPAEPPVEDSIGAGEPAFDLAGYIASLPADQQDLHRRANRVAKVSMQDIKLLKPSEVQQGRENKDICARLRIDLDKARKEYDRRFRAIQDHPVDYFHRWMVEILAGGDTHALGEYPYPSPVMRH